MGDTASQLIPTKIYKKNCFSFSINPKEKADRGIYTSEIEVEEQNPPANNSLL